MQPDWLSEKNHTTSSHTKSMLPLHTQNHTNSDGSNSDSSNSDGFYSSDSSGSMDSSEKNHATSQQQQKTHTL